MAKMRLTNVHPELDGEYPLDTDTGYNKWELHCIKKLTGLAGMDLFEAIEKEDPDIVVGLAMVMLMRNGKIQSPTPWTSAQVKLLWTSGEISEVAEEEAEIGPPEVTLDLSSNSETTSETETKPSGSSEGSGINGSTPSEIPEPSPSPTGLLN